jgi:cytochrome-b5 reductase
MYQILIHALTKPENKTKFKLIFANISEKDILLKEELDALKKKYPETFDVVYTVDAAGPGWNGEGNDAFLIDLRLTLHWPGRTLGLRYS